MDTTQATITQRDNPTLSVATGQATQPDRRQYDLDWLRVLAILCVFLFHTAKFFVELDWNVTNTQLALGMTILTWIVSQWLMPLLFIISAVGIYYSLNTRNNKQFLAARFKRLLIPFVFGILILIPPQVYIERITHAQFTGSFFQFFPHYFEGWYGFGGNFAWMGLHLWYLFLLFLFSLMMLPCFRYLKQAKWSAVVLQKIPLFQGEKSLVFLVVGTGIIEALVNLQPNGVGRRDFGGWSPVTSLGFFLFGYLLALTPQVISRFERNRRRTLLLGLFTTLISLFLLGVVRASEYGILFSFLRSLNAWLWLATLLGFGKRYLNFQNTLLLKANQAALPFYILHQTVIVIIAFFLITWPIPVLLKYPLLALGSFVIIIGLYEGVIRRLPLLRFFFGMKAM